MLWINLIDMSFNQLDFNNMVSIDLSRTNFSQRLRFINYFTANQHID